MGRAYRRVEVDSLESRMVCRLDFPVLVMAALLLAMGVAPVTAWPQEAPEASPIVESETLPEVAGSDPETRF